MTREIFPKLECGEWRCADGLVWWEAAVGPAALVCTTRIGGGSAPPYEALNLGLHVGDAAAAVVENRRALWTVSAPGAAAPVVAEQVHGTQVASVGTGDAGRGWLSRETEISGTDALVTRETGVPMAILVADCAPVALVAPAGVLAVAHAGWRGLASGVLEAALQRMAEWGAGPPQHVHAVVGPCIRGCCYEVEEEVWRRFPQECLAPSGPPNARRLDLLAAVVHRLRAAGVPPGQIHTVGLCTACHPRLFFSHRRATQEGLSATGRMALFARLPGVSTKANRQSE